MKWTLILYYNIYALTVFERVKFEKKHLQRLYKPRGGKKAERRLKRQLVEASSSLLRGSSQ